MPQSKIGYFILEFLSLYNTTDGQLFLTQTSSTGLKSLELPFDHVPRIHLGQTAK